MTTKKTPHETLEFYLARIANADRWVPACSGTENPFVSRGGPRLLYCWNPCQQRHAYLNVDTDMIIEPEEAAMLLGL